MIMKLRTTADGSIWGERKIADGVTLHFIKHAHDGCNELYIVRDEDVLLNINPTTTLRKNAFSCMYRESCGYDELEGINVPALRYEIDGDNLILYYSFSRLLKVLKKAGITYSRKIEIENPYSPNIRRI